MTFQTDNWPQPADDVTRAMPHAVGPEKSVLSSCLQFPIEALGVCAEIGITEDFFYLPAHRTLFAELMRRFAGSEAIEFVSLTTDLLDAGKLASIGGPSVMTDLYTYATGMGHFRHHLDMVRDKHILRRQIQVCSLGIQNAYDSPGEALETLDELESGIMAIRESLEVTSSQMTIKQAVVSVMADFEEQIKGKVIGPGLATGFEELDRMGLMKPGDMFIVAARPSMGKTSFMMNVVEHVVFESQKPVLVFSAEMTTKQLTHRLIFSRAKFAISQMSRGYSPTKGDLQRIQKASLEIASGKIYVDDSEGISINAIRAKARRIKREHGIEFIAVDYLQLLKSGSKQAQNSREREIAEISSGIKGLAKELGIPIMVLAQLNRGPESRAGKKKGVPKMSDLRESGSIEQDADMVGLLYREAYYAENENEKEASAGFAQLDLAKNRNGETGQVPLTFIADLMRFETGVPFREQAGEGWVE
jgi:replicative DNA helicase